MTSTIDIGKAAASKKPFSFFGRLRPQLNGYLHRYAKLRGVRWTRYAKTSKLKEEVAELLEALADYEADPSSKKHRHLQEETADVVFCLAGIAEKAGFDLHDAIEHKIRKDKGRNGSK